MSATKEEYKATGITFNRCILSTESGNIDIKDMVLEFEVFESIFSTTLTANIYLTDTVGLVERLPLMGGEYVTLSWRTPTFEKDINLLFVVTNVPAREVHSTKSSSYALTLLTEDAVTGLSGDISRAYNGVPAHKAIEALVENVFVPNRKQKKKLNTEVASNSISYVAPSIGPFYVIDDITREAVSSKGKADYVFYEDHDQYNFVSLTSLKNAKVVESYYLAEFQTSEGEYGNEAEQNLRVNDSQRISGISFVSAFDLREQINEGVANVRTQVIDPVLKRFTDTDYKYSSKKSFDLGKVTPFNNVGGVAKVNNGGHKRFIVSNLTDGRQYNKMPYIDGRIVVKDNKTSDWQSAFPRLRHNSLGQVVADRMALSTITLNITIAGNSNRKPGEVINVFIPQNSYEEEFKKEYNILFGDKKEAKFLVTAVKHQYSATEKKYFTILSCSKDSYETNKREIDRVIKK